MYENAYRVFSHKKGRMAPSTAGQYYARNKFFIRWNSLQRHMNSCALIPGIVYKFENQNMQTLFDNVKFVGDLSFSIYFDFETTSGKKIYNSDNDLLSCFLAICGGILLKPKHRQNIYCVKF